MKIESTLVLDGFFFSCILAIKEVEQINCFTWSLTAVEANTEIELQAPAWEQL